MSAKLHAISTRFKVPEQFGEGEFLVGITREEGGFSGRVTFNEWGPDSPKMRFFFAWINYSSRGVGDTQVIRMAIAQALEDGYFKRGKKVAPDAKFELRMNIHPYDGDLHFFE